MNKNKALLKAIIINSIFLALVIIFCDMKYEVSDDFVMQSIIEGAYGDTYDSHLLYSNILLGYGLKCLYLLVPQVGWYFVMHITLCFLSLTAMSYIVLDACEGKANNVQMFGLAVVVAFVSFFSDDVYILVQFTKTAAVACFSGAALVVYEYNKSCDSKLRKIIGMICGTVLCLFGTMVRSATMNIAIMFLMLVFAVDVVVGFKGALGKSKMAVAQGETGNCDVKKFDTERDSFDNSKSVWLNFVKKILLEIVIAISIYLAARGLILLNRYIWNSDEVYGEYQKWNALRSSVTDISGADIEVIRAGLLEAGYTLEDTYMVQSWEFADQSYFDEETIRDIASIKREKCEDVVASKRQVLNMVMERGYYRYTILWGLVLLAILLLALNYRYWWIVLMSFGLVGLQVLYCIYHLKIVYRVEYCFFYCAAGTLVYTISKLLVIDDNALVKKYSGESEKSYLTQIRVITIFVVLLMIAKIPLYIPDTSYKTMEDDEYTAYVEDVLYTSWGFDLRKYRIDVSHRNPYGDLIELMENDEEHYYLCDFLTTIQLLYYGYKPWEAMPIGYYKDTYSYIGGVTSYFPGCYLVWNENEIDYINPYKSIANENIRLVDNYYYLTKARYYNEKYNPQAELSLVDKLDGVMIWEIR